MPHTGSPGRKPKSVMALSRITKFSTKGTQIAPKAPLVAWASRVTSRCKVRAIVFALMVRF